MVSWPTKSNKKQLTETYNQPCHLPLKFYNYMTQFKSDTAS